MFVGIETGMGPQRSRVIINDWNIVSECRDSSDEREGDQSQVAEGRAEGGDMTSSHLITSLVTASLETHGGALLS